MSARHLMKYVSKDDKISIKKVRKLLRPLIYVVCATISFHVHFQAVRLYWAPFKHGVLNWKCEHLKCAKLRVDQQRGEL